MRRSGAELTGQTDAELLRRYLDGRDSAALTELVTRHAPLVRGVCLRVLGPTADADDVFQATFLVLVRRGERIRRPQSLAAWLYGVAHRIALRFRQSRRTQRAKTKPIPGAPATVEWDPLAEVAARHEMSVFDAELARLPEKYRAPIILHHLEGRSLQEVAQTLHLSLGTVDGRLKRGRNELRIRLAQRGIVFGATLIILRFQQEAAAAVAPEAAIEATVDAALSFDPISPPDLTNANVFRLAHQELVTMTFSQVASAASAALLAVLLLGGFGYGAATFAQPAGPSTPWIIRSNLAAVLAPGEPADAVSVEPVGDTTAAAERPKKAMEDVLDEPTSIEVDGERLRDVLQTLAAKHGIRIKLDGLRIGHDGLSKSPDQRVTFAAQDLTLRELLRPLLEPVALDYLVEKDGLVVTSVRRLQQKRPRTFRNPTAAEMKIESALNEQTELSFVDTSLFDALDYIKQLHKFDIVVAKEISYTQKPEALTVNLEVSGVSLRSALNLMLEPMGFAYVLKNDVLMIVTKEEVEANRELRIYNLEVLRPLWGDIDFENRDQVERAELAVRHAVGGRWAPQEQEGGTPSLTKAGLIVRHNRKIHREMETLIDQLELAGSRR